MKKIIACLLIVCMTFGFQTVFASDYAIVDVHNYMYGCLALTSDGDVYKTDSLTSSKKEHISSGVSSLTNDENVFLLKNGNLKYYDKEIPGLNIKKIIDVNEGESYGVLYIDCNNVLKLFNPTSSDVTIIIDDCLEVENCIYGNHIYSGYILTSKKDLYFFRIKEQPKYIASNVIDFEPASSDMYYLKESGELYKYNLESLQSETVMNNVDISQGIEVDGSEVLVYSSDGNFYMNGNYSAKGNFVAFKESDAMIAFGCNQGVNDIAIYTHTIYYIGKDNKLYAYNLYDYYAPSKKSLKCVSSGIDFKKIITPGGSTSEGLYAIDVNNNLYCISPASATSDACLNNCVPNALPKKFAYHNGMLVLTEAGECYIVPWGKTYISQSCFNNKDINIIVNNKEVELQSPIQNVNGRSMYPLRECFNAMGAGVTWDGNNKIAIGELPGKKIEFPIGKSEYWVNGVKHEMDVPAYVDESIGRTYIPIRYAAEGLGFKVDWKEGKTENTIDIHN